MSIANLQFLKDSCYIHECFFIMQVIVGVHNDESYFKLKKKKPIDNTERRMENVKKYADQVNAKGVRST